MNKLGLVVLLNCAVLAVGCSGDDNGTTSSNDASVGDAFFLLDVMVPPVNRDGASDAAAVNDDQIVGILNAANTGEIQEGQLVQDTAFNAGVSAYAAQMVTDHTAANAGLVTLEQQASLTPSPSFEQQELQTSATQTLASLQALTGNTFGYDAAYVQSQVTAHTTVLSFLDNSLIPNAQAPALKTLLQTTRTMVAMHLQLAQALEAELVDAGPAFDSGLSDDAGKGGPHDGGGFVDGGDGGSIGTTDGGGADGGAHGGGLDASGD